uniref:Uncharacterized protein n=1 Tax=Cacopsylla melanoneura TaxID=428564 RepID=A0A8D8ZMF5_9HEMI
MTKICENDVGTLLYNIEYLLYFKASCCLSRERFLISTYEFQRTLIFFLFLFFEIILYYPVLHYIINIIMVTYYLQFTKLLDQKSLKVCPKVFLESLDIFSQPNNREKKT